MKDFPDDIETIGEIAQTVASYWNENGGPEHGVSVLWSREAADKISHEGDQILAGFFPDPPGPFKRLATFLVLSRLQPLFALVPPAAGIDNLKPVQPGFHDEWIARVTYLLIEPTLQVLKVHGKGGQVISLTEWADFPSLHTKTEFLFWLEWLRDYPPGYLRHDVSDAEGRERRGRMALATALILEQAYYCKGGNTALCRMCDRNLIDAMDHRLLFFDAFLADTQEKNAKA
jgi:hypothetical protein